MRQRLTGKILIVSTLFLASCEIPECGQCEDILLEAIESCDRQGKTVDHESWQCFTDTFGCAVGGHWDCKLPDNPQDETPLGQ
jgi:hypothetical protein